jgi:uncharacterized 2Fe-2S/4Fe-4S cluster protein (DUF4445 family)
MTPLIIKKKIHLPLPSDDDRRAYDQRIKDTLGIASLAIPLPVLKRVPAQLKKQNGVLSCIIGRMDSGHKLIDIGCERSYSLALDIGTTNLVFLLYDNNTGTTIFSQSFENPQITFGSDILTRMHHAMTLQADEVSIALKRGINHAIRLMCEKAGITAYEVHALAVAGNTVMSHFFLGLDISTIPVDPFVPVVRTPGFFTAAELAMDINPEALVYVFPNAGSYVGGDIVAGIIASGLHRADKISILIDVGTNAEIVIGNKDWMLVGAGAAGPALEEGISRIGKRASKGIIYDVKIRDGAITCKTFDEHTPEGICGSGMVSLLSELYSAGIIDKSGMLSSVGQNVSIIDGEPVYGIACGCDEALSIRQSEIQNFMKSKAAMFTLLLVLVRSVGLGFKDIARVFVSGALGTGIDANKAAAIGMLPAWPANIVKSLGNTSLEGARMLLADGELVRTIDSVTAKITYKHMHDDPEFMKEFMGAVFIPHTNPELLTAT